MEKVMTELKTKSDMKEIIEKGGILVRTICEILGGPKEHVEETIKVLVQKAAELKDAWLIKYKIYPAEKQETLFASFAEIEILFKNQSELLDFCFNFMPSSVEIVEPQKFVMTSTLFTNWINDLQGRLHSIDKIAKEANAYKKLLNQRIASIVRYNFLSHLKDKKLSKNELLSKVGIDKEGFEVYLKSLIDRGEIIEEKGKLKLSEIVKFND